MICYLTNQMVGCLMNFPSGIVNSLLKSQLKQEFRKNICKWKSTLIRTINCFNKIGAKVINWDARIFYDAIERTTQDAGRCVCK